MGLPYDFYENFRQVVVNTAVSLHGDKLHNKFLLLCLVPGYAFV